MNENPASSAQQHDRRCDFDGGNANALAHTGLPTNGGGIALDFRTGQPASRPSQHVARLADNDRHAKALQARQCRGDIGRAGSLRVDIFAAPLASRLSHMHVLQMNVGDGRLCGRSKTRSKRRQVVFQRDQIRQRTAVRMGTLPCHHVIRYNTHQVGRQTRPGSARSRSQRHRRKYSKTVALRSCWSVRCCSSLHTRVILALVRTLRGEKQLKCCTRCSCTHSALRLGLPGASPQAL
jgi:hypothetical protein